MEQNRGFFEEEEMVIALNGKKFSELSNNCKYIVQNVFGHVKDDDVIMCKQMEGFNKPDLKISINQRSNYISMKSGSNIIVHQENIFSLCDALRKEGISEDTIETILLFHFGDGTTNGTGKERFPYEKNYHEYYDRIQKANEEINAQKNVRISIAYRFLFQGIHELAPSADFIYHGDKDYGVIASKQQILEYLFRGYWGFYENLHVGPLMLKPHARYIGKEIKSVKRRETVDVQWPNMFTQIRYISTRFNGLFTKENKSRR